VSICDLGCQFLAFELNDSRIPCGDQQRRGPLKSFPVFRNLDQAIVSYDNGLAVNAMIIDLPTVALGIDPDHLFRPVRLFLNLLNGNRLTGHAPGSD
jgi:hypothetical protein